jgi:hypothetical protein
MNAVWKIIAGLSLEGAKFHDNYIIILEPQS